MRKRRRLSGLAVTPDGASDCVIYFADSRNNQVRRITREGRIETAAGCATAGDDGDGGLATAAKLNDPHGLAWWGKDVLLISDHYNNRVKAVRV